MATRAIYKFIDDYSTYCVYKHSDNYPSGAAVFIKNALNLSWKLPRFEADEFSASFVAANKTGGGGVYLVHEANVDEDSLRLLDYLYEIRLKDNKIHVDAFDTQEKTYCFNGSLAKFRAKYRMK